MTHFELLKYAATGIASPGMTAYDKMRAVAMAGGKVKTLTGVPPLSFTGNGKPLISWSMLGNSQQTGTPSPDNPIMPEFVGERTANLFDKNSMVVGYYLAKATGVYTATTGESRSVLVKVEPSTTYTITGTSWTKRIALFDNMPQNGDTPNYYSDNGTTTYEETSLTFMTLPTTQYLVFFNYSGSTEYPYNKTLNNVMSSVMLNTGSTAIPYEPYGWKIPVTSAGQTVPVYLGQVQTTRKIKKLVLTGDESGWTDATFDGNHFFLSPVLSGGAVIYIGALSTHYMPSNAGGAQRPNNSIRQVIYVAAYSQLSIRDDACTTITDFKTYLQQQYAARTPVTVWYVLATPTTGIVNEPLAKIGTYADELYSEDAGVSIPTARGANTLTVDTELQPSSMTITYRE